MSDRIESLAKKVEQANNDLLSAVEGVNDEQWRERCADGDWTKGFAGYQTAASTGASPACCKGSSTE